MIGFLKESGGGCYEVVFFEKEFYSCSELQDNRLRM